MRNVKYNRPPIQPWREKRKHQLSPLCFLWFYGQLTKAWYAVLNKTFVNSLKMSGISEEAEERTFLDEDGSFTGLENMQEDSVNNLESSLIFFKETFCEQVENGK